MGSDRSLSTSLIWGSIRNPSLNEKDDAELWDEMEKVYKYNAVVQRWGSGLEDEIAEKGDKLWVDQRQLPCIDRAFIRESEVIVMDEATASSSKT
ncbi:hypothetical protein PINS_up020387 [Pythium insidiosum]|nr:hypothetical protein PINS_up020387 [Pythium insidiosum]